MRHGRSESHRLPIERSTGERAAQALRFEGVFQSRMRLLHRTPPSATPEERLGAQRRVVLCRQAERGAGGLDGGRPILEAQMAGGNVDVNRHRDGISLRQMRALQLNAQLVVDKGERALVLSKRPADVAAGKNVVRLHPGDRGSPFSDLATPHDK